VSVRTPLVAGNWKMHTTHAEAQALARAICDGAASVAGADIVLCPPFVHMHAVGEAIAGTRVALGAQDMHPEERGAFTGEVSVTQVSEVAAYVIIGHSERRQLFGETDESVHLKVRSALAHGLRPIMCVGETLEERQAEKTHDVLVRQVTSGLSGIGAPAELVVAYEPIWAIGTGLAADAATAQQAIGLIRRTLREIAGEGADAVRILYGGSVTGENMGEFITQPDIDGGLVGGASLKAESFLRIIEVTAAASAPRGA
jgi:triosephosphate isomerase